MPTIIKEFAGWIAAEQTLGEALGVIFKKLETEPWSSDPNSDYARLRAASRKVVDELFVAARLELRQVDDAIASSPVVKQLNAEAKLAKAEAGKLKAATATIDQITGVIDKAAGVLTKIVGLPFL